MRNLFYLLTLILLTIQVNAQVGIGTISPNSTLDLRGSFSAAYRSFTSATGLTTNDYTAVFTGSSATTATLPDATTCPGRTYCIKNFSPGPLIAFLTINTVSSQKIDGLASWLLDKANEAMLIGSDGSNWEIMSLTVPVVGGAWNEGGNNVTAMKSLGTISPFDLPIITNNTEKMRITSNGYVGIGSTAFSVNPEALLVYQNSNSSFNVIAGKGNLNNYLQLNIQNLNGGTNASSDVVATADNGNELTNYVDMGMNSSGNTSAIMGSPDDAYLYTAGNNFLFGTANVGKALLFLTGGTSQASNERMRIDGTGNVGIGTTSPSYRLQVNAASNPLYLGGVQTGLNTDSILTIINGVVRKLQPGALVTSSSNAWSLIGNAGTSPASNFFGTTDAQAFIFKENNSQVARFENTSIALGSGATTANSPNCYAFGSGANIGFNKLNSVAIGTNATVTNDSSFSIGTAAATSAQNAFSIGSGSQANSLNSFAIGRNAYVGYSTSDALAIGTNATVSGANAISIGSNITAASKTQATAASSIAMGNAAAANSANAIAIGTGATSGYSLTSPVAIGNAATANGSNAVVIGNGANIGFVSNATALGAGASVTSTGNNSTAVGYNTAVTKANEVILGDMTNTALSVGIGTENFSGTNREKLLVDAGATSSVNAIVGRGNINNYLQLNIQNQSSGANASSDVVATADNGNEISNYVDLGINGSTNASGIMGAANDAYLYNIGQNFLIGTGAAAKSLIFMTGGTTQSTNERMRISGSGNVGIGNNAPAATLDVNGTVKLGTAGSILNSIIRFTNQSITDNTAFNVNGRTMTFTLAGVNQNASVIVTPRSALPLGMLIAYSYASATNTVLVNFISASNQALGTVVFDFTVIQ